MKKRGFTLIELLVTIVIISLVLGLSIYIISNVINNSKTKTQQISINDMERMASNYSIEESSLTWKQKDNYEYICITVEELVDKGLLKTETINNNYLYNYILIKKDSTTKALTSTKLITDELETPDDSVCTGNNSDIVTQKPFYTVGNIYTDEINNIRYSDAIAKKNIISGTRKCYYGTTTNNLNNVVNSDEKNKICHFDSLKANTTYYIRVCMDLEGNNSTCSKTMGYKTKNIEAPNIETNANISVTTNFNSNNIKGDHYNYIYSPLTGESNTDLQKCNLNNNQMNCETNITRNINASTWYKVNSDNITISYQTSGSGSFYAREYDKTGNYRESEGKLQPNDIQIIFHRNTKNDDTVTLEQTIKSSDTNKKFGYNSSGNLIWKETGQFNDWNVTGYTLKGWATSKDAKSAEWDKYYDVSNEWISNNAPSIDLYAIWIDDIPPVISGMPSESTTWCSGKSMTPTCTDSGSDVKSLTITDNGTVVNSLKINTTRDKNIKTTLTCTDNAGNVTTQDYYYKVVNYSCNEYYGCRDSSFGCETYVQKTGSICGCKTYNSKAASPCSCKAYKSCRDPSFGCETCSRYNYSKWELQGNQASGSTSDTCKNKTGTTYKYVGCAFKQNTCKCAYWTRKVESCATCSLYKSKRDSSCGCETYNLCSHSSFGCETYNSCRNSSFGCETYNYDYGSVCGCKEANCSR